MRSALPGLAAALAAGLTAASGGQVAVDTELVTDAVTFPTSVTAAPGEPQHLFVTERAGRIRVVENGELLETPFLDIEALVNSDPPERALACLAFHPDYQTNGRFFITYTDLESRGTLAAVNVTADPNVADPASLTVLMTIDQPFPTHNVGWIDFGPDGYLYVGSGDGGAGTGGQFAQDVETLLGKILRLDVDSAAPYAVPPDNPFVGAPGRDEIWALGLRNPWRCSFDRQSGDLWIGDVGDATREEISFQPAASPGGANYGWNCTEGTICHEPAHGCTCGQAGLVAPVHDYDHDTGCAVIGGYVYRGSLLPALRGLYVFGDLCGAKVWALDPASGEVTLLLQQPAITSFGEDNEGELYITTTTSQVLRLTFVDCNGNGAPDDQDIGDGTSLDCNGNGTPDECEPDCNDNGVPDDCDIADGTSPDDNGNGFPDECDDAADLDGDGMVGVEDFLLLLAAWGPCPDPPEPCPADLDADGSVGTTDFLTLLARWG